MEFINKRTGEKKEINFRPFEYRDAPSIIKCIYDAYEDTYVKPYLYSEENIISLYESKDLVFTVAENEEDGIIGILGNQRSKHFKNQNELVTQVIIKKYRGFGISKAHFKYHLQLLIDDPCIAFFGHALGSQIISQLNLTQLGFTPCGFILSLFDQNAFSTGVTSDNQKISQAVVVKPQQTNKRVTLYVKPYLVPILEKTYQQFGMEYNIVNADEGLCQESIIYSENNSIHQTLTIFVSACGEDLEMKMKALIDQYSSTPLQTINLFLNMESSTAIKGYTILQKLGFIFTGLQPLCEDAEYLIMHHPLRVVTDINKVPYIDSFSDYAHFIEKELQTYVQE